MYVCTYIRINRNSVELAGTKWRPHNHVYDNDVAAGRSRRPHRRCRCAVVASSGLFIALTARIIEKEAQQDMTTPPLHPIPHGRETPFYHIN